MLPLALALHLLAAAEEPDPPLVAAAGVATTGGHTTPAGGHAADDELGTPATGLGSGSKASRSAPAPATHGPDTPPRPVTRLHSPETTVNHSSSSANESLFAAS